MDNYEINATTSYSVYLMTLGCDKNRVDGEVMLGNLVAAGMIPAMEAAAADAIIVNTCGFIREATQESIDAVLEMAAYKSNPEAKCRALVIVGCMSERYREETKTEIPEADAVLGVKDTDGIVQVMADLLGFTPHSNSHDHHKRIAARRYVEAPHIAHVKISDGCDNACTYCTIPSIRGAYASRHIEDIVMECESLLATGTREIVLVAQDTALYGVDLYGKPRLHDLLNEISNLQSDIWIRLMYAYPEHITPEIIHAIASLPNVCKYIDMPIQHSETSVLKRMGRKSTKEGLINLITQLRNEIPGIALRTTLMVGFPGETVDDFRNLYAFVEEMKFDRLGVFPYSREEGTPAASMPKQVKQEVKHTRLDRLMRLQQGIHQQKQQAKISQTVKVIIDKAGEIYEGRTAHDAYEVDAVVRFNNNTDHQLKPGDIVSITIADADEYDLTGVLA